MTHDNPTTFQIVISSKMLKALLTIITATGISTSVFADEIIVSENIKLCAATTSENEPFQYHVVEVFDGLILADYNVEPLTDGRPFNRLFKKLNDGSWYYRGAATDSLMELTINDYYTFTNTNLITEAVEFDYSNPNKCDVFTITKPLTYDEKAVKQHCDKKWTKRGERDDRMYDHCVKEQVEGFAELKDAVVQYENIPFIANMFINLIDDWTERDFTDYDQIDFAIRNNGESYLNIEWELKNYDDEVRPLLRTHLIYDFDPKEASYRQLEYLIEEGR